MEYLQGFDLIHLWERSPANRQRNFPAINPCAPGKTGMNAHCAVFFLFFQLKNWRPHTDSNRGPTDYKSQKPRNLAVVPHRLHSSSLSSKNSSQGLCFIDFLTLSPNHFASTFVAYCPRHSLAKKCPPYVPQRVSGGTNQTGAAPMKVELTDRFLRGLDTPSAGRIEVFRYQAPRPAVPPDRRRARDVGSMRKG